MRKFVLICDICKMNTGNYIIRGFCLIALLILIAQNTNAQESELGEEMRRWLREQQERTIEPDLRIPQQQQQPFLNFPQIQHQLQRQPEVLRISPTTRLPSYLDRIPIADSTELILLRKMFDNVNFALNNIPPETMRPLNQGIVSGDFCPGRALERRRHRRHQEQLDRLGIEWRHLQNRWDMREIYELNDIVNQMRYELKSRED